MSLLGQQQNGRGYATIGPDDVPLLRPPDSNKCRVLNYSLVVITFVLVLATLVSAIVYNKTSSTGVNIFFLVCILLSCLSNILLILYYSRQAVPSKLRLLIYFNTLNTLLFCICANLFFHGL